MDEEVNNYSTTDNSDADISTAQKAKAANDRDQYYNVAYEVQNFLGTTFEDASAIQPKYMNDAKVNGFKLFFHFDATVGLLAAENHMNSALAYLKRLGQEERYKRLKLFINLLSVINSEAPWIFQDIEGIQETWTAPFSDVYKNRQIKISTLESVDEKIQALMYLYRKSVFDDSRGVWVVPKNLREFSMSIYVYDYRVFQKTSIANGFLQTDANLDVKLINHTLFDYGSCEFSNASGAEAFSSISNNASTFITSSIVINTEQSAISGLYKTLADLTTDDKKMTEAFFEGSKALSFSTSKRWVPEGNLFSVDAWKTSIKGKLQEKLKYEAKNNEYIKSATEKVNRMLDPNTWKRELGNTIEKGYEYLKDKAELMIGKIYLGNVTGFGLSDILQIGDSGSFIDDIVKVTRKAATGDTHLTSLQFKNTKVSKGELGNNSNDSLSGSATLDDDNIQTTGKLGNIN
jgi:hypothetical protein